jgi:flagellar biosynthetic protein FlhB
MADAPDKESQTEEATEKKLSEALERGIVPHSPEVAVFATLAAMLVTAMFILPSTASRLTSLLARFIDDPGGWTIDSADDAHARHDYCR